MSSIGSSPEQQPIHDSEAAAPQQQGSAEELDTSFFPNPPIYFSRYTTANLALLPTERLVDDEKLLAQELLPPREDWIREGGSYTVFGETWPVIEVVPTLEEMGVTEMFDRHTERSTSLTSLLQALLVTYSQLIAALLVPPPKIDDNAEPEPTIPEKLVEHIRLISINMHYLINQLRPIQARETLKSMMRQQIDARRAKTLAIKQQCAELSATLLEAQSDIESSGRNDIYPAEDIVPSTLTTQYNEEEDYERIRRGVELIEKEGGEN